MAAMAEVTICDYPEGSMLPRLAAFVHGVYAQRHGHLEHRGRGGGYRGGNPKKCSKMMG